MNAVQDTTVIQIVTNWISDILHNQANCYDLDYCTEEEWLEICFYPEKDDAAASTRVAIPGRKRRETLPTLADWASG